MSLFDYEDFGDAIPPRILVYELLNHEQLKDISAVTISKWISFSGNRNYVSEDLIRRYKSSKCEANISFERLIVISEGIYENVAKDSELMRIIENILMFNKLSKERNDWNRLTQLEQTSKAQALKKIEKKIQIEKSKDEEQLKRYVIALMHNLNHHQILDLVAKTINEHIRRSI